MAVSQTGATGLMVREYFQGKLVCDLKEQKREILESRVSLSESLNP